MPGDHMAQATTITMDMVDQLTQREISPEMYQELHQLQKTYYRKDWDMNIIKHQPKKLDLKLNHRSAPSKRLYQICALTRQTELWHSPFLLPVIP